MDTTSKRYSDRPRASVLTIINFLLLCLVLIFMFSLSAKIESPTSTTAVGSTTTTDTSNVQQQITDLGTKIDALTTSVQANKSTSTKPFNYLSCNGSTINNGSLSTMSSQCYPY